MKKYLIFIDESGDPNLFKIDLQYPVFGLGAIIFEENYYYNTVISSVAKIKKDNGFDIILPFHSSDIRKLRGGYESLFDRSNREKFYRDINNFFSNTNFCIVSTVIKKPELKILYSQPGCPYDLSLQFILERCEHFLRNRNGVGEIYIERKCGEELKLQKVFSRLKTDGNGYISSFGFRSVFPQENLIFVDKSSVGAQLIDLAIYPITSKILKPDSENLAFDIIKPKLYSGNLGNISKYGLKVFP